MNQELNETKEQLVIDNHSSWDPIGELELKVNPNDKDDYNEIIKILTQYLTYPSTEAAEFHMECDRLGNYDLKSSLEEQMENNKKGSVLKQSKEFCPCCGFVRQLNHLKLSTRLREVNNIGISTYLYFQTIKNLVILLISLILLYSIYALTTNLIASGVLKESGLDLTSANSYNSLSLGSKQENKTDINSKYYFIQCWIGLGVMVFWFFLFFLLKYQEKVEESEIQEETISAADFSICIENAPRDITKEELQKSMNEYYETIENEVPKHMKKPLTIKQLNIGKPFYLNEKDFKDEEIDKLQENHKQCVETFVNWIEERRTLPTFSQTSEQRQEVYKKWEVNFEEQVSKYSEIQEKVLAKFKESSEENRSATTTIFVTFEDSNAAKMLLSLNDSSFVGKIRYLLSCCRDGKRFRFFRDSVNHHVKVKKAPEPEDIVWANIGVSDCEKYKRKFITYFATLLLLGASFGIVYSLSIAQQRNPSNSVLSLAISAIISIINMVLLMVIRELSAYERNFTETDHQASLAVKAIFASLINSILIPMMVNKFIKNKIYEENGLASDVFMLGLTNSFLAPGLKLVDPTFILNRLFKWKASWTSKLFFTLGSRLKANQQELNLEYSYMIFEVGYEYVYLVSLFLFTCFFVSLQPIISVFAAVGMGLMYWTQKNSLFNRMRRPIPGTDMVNLSMFQLIICGGVFYCLGSLTWSNFLPGGIPAQALVPNLIALGVSLLALFMPYNQFLASCLPENLNINREYSKNRIILPSEYDRLNPVTAAEGIQNFRKFYEEEMNKMETAPEEIKNNILDQLFKQGARGHYNHQGGITAQHSRGFMPPPQFIQPQMMAQFFYQHPQQNSQLQNVPQPHPNRFPQQASQQMPPPFFPSSIPTNPTHFNPMNSNIPGTIPIGFQPPPRFIPQGYQRQPYFQPPPHFIQPFNQRPPPMFIPQQRDRWVNQRNHGTQLNQQGFMEQPMMQAGLNAFHSFMF